MLFTRVCKVYGILTVLATGSGYAIHMPYHQHISTIVCWRVVVRLEFRRGVDGVLEGGCEVVLASFVCENNQLAEARQCLIWYPLFLCGVCAVGEERFDGFPVC